MSETLTPAVRSPSPVHSTLQGLDIGEVMPKVDLDAALERAAIAEIRLRESYAGASAGAFNYRDEPERPEARIVV